MLASLQYMDVADKRMTYMRVVVAVVEVVEVVVL